MRLRARWSWQHLWIGVAWFTNRSLRRLYAETWGLGVEVYDVTEIHLTLCILPCLPLHISWIRSVKQEEGNDDN